VGPIVVGPAGTIVGGWGINELAGAYLVSLILFAVAAIVVFIGLRPDPREIGKEVAEKFPEAVTVSNQARNVFEILRQPTTLVSVTAMVFGQMVMVLVMVITSLHMHDHQHGL